MATTRRAPQTSAPGDGSRTVTITAANPEEAEADSQPGPSTTEPQPPLRSVLKLRGGPRSRPQVQWTEDVVDNEGAGRKKSKSACITRQKLETIPLTHGGAFSLLYLP